VRNLFYLLEEKMNVDIGFDIVCLVGLNSAAPWHFNHFTHEKFEHVLSVYQNYFGSIVDGPEVKFDNRKIVVVRLKNDTP
jgi:hypothetical protein